MTITCRPNHGLQTAYEYGLDIGGMDRSKYFGYPKDLYHFDHFMGVTHAFIDIKFPFNENKTGDSVSCIHSAQALV